MKTKIIILSAALIITTTGCDQKTDLTAQSSAAKQEATQHHPVPAEQAMQSKQEAARKAVKAVENIELKDTPVMQKSTEQSLAEVSTLGREKTRSQESKSRTRAQIAEDEMLKDLESFK
jgi:hypothetical protein